jgi:serine/threonine protein kinase
MSETRKIGRYEVQSLLGEGAMGSVYRAFDPFVERTVAIKTIKPDKAGQNEVREFHDRFIQEAKISGKLNHPNIVAIYDVGEEQGMPYIAMEFVDGSTLSDVIRLDVTPTYAELMQILMQIASALDFAHERGIVHRDLKPSNIMVMKNGIAKIMDFGIAKMSGTNLTQTGVFLGTPSYSSPEQVKEGHVDSRSDLFSFAILAHETLTGQLPFPGSSINAILYKIANEPPTECTNLADLPVDPQSWRDVFAKGLNKDAEIRFQTAVSFVNALFGTLKITDTEATRIGHFMGQMGSTIRSQFQVGTQAGLGSGQQETIASDSHGVQRDLRRSEFEQSQADTPTVKTPTLNKKRGGNRGALLAAIVLILLAVVGLGLYQTGQLQSLLKQFGLMADETIPVEVVNQTEVIDPHILDSQSTTQPQQPQVASRLERTLEIRTDPERADVFINDQHTGLSPLEYVWVDNVNSKITIRFEKEGYENHVETFVLNEALTLLHEIKLKPFLERRTLTVIPADATVLIDGNALDGPPFEFDAIAGEPIRIEIEREGYHKAVRTYEEGRHSPDKLAINLQPLPPPGKLEIDTDMSDFEIVVDGDRHKKTSLELQPGQYQVSLRAPKYFFEQKRDINISSEQTLKLETPILIEIPKIELIGGYAHVRINGFMIKTQDGKDDITPIVDIKIPAGTHEFEFIDTNDKILVQKTIEVTRRESIIVADN